VVNASEQLPFPEARFDALPVLTQSIIFQIGRWWLPMARLVKPGGRLLFHRSRHCDCPLTNEEIAVRSSAGSSVCS